MFRKIPFLLYLTGNVFAQCIQGHLKQKIRVGRGEIHSCDNLTNKFVSLHSTTMYYFYIFISYIFSIITI